MNNSYKNKVLGSLVGGAVGDALGYPVEFMTYNQIVQQYGQSGITRYELNHRGVAEISDDTQMTLFTANGLLVAFTHYVRCEYLDTRPSDFVRQSYIEWYQTQIGDIDHTKPHYNWIRDINQLHVRRAPGTTCMSALWALAQQSEVLNNSKGCGGIMRVAPIGLLAASPADPHFNPYIPFHKKYAKEAGNLAFLTHKHPLGYIPAAFLSLLIEQIVPNAFMSRDQLHDCCDTCISTMREIYPSHASEIDYIHQLLQTAWFLASSDNADFEAINQIGEGWVAEETLAIALYCVFKYPDNFEKAVVAAVNHSGDSDSTGAVTGNIMGALLGYELIPEYYKEHLELRWLIEEIATDLATDISVILHDGRCDTPEAQEWLRKYIEVVTQ